MMGLGEKIKGIGDLIVKVHDADLKADLQQRILDLQSDCFTLQEKNAGLLEENAKLRGQLQKVEDREKMLAQLKLERNAYWKDDTPYCISCVHKQHQLIPLARRRGQSTEAYCPTCKTPFSNVYGDDLPPHAPSVVK